MKRTVKRLFCSHEYKESAVYLDEKKLVESCSNCGTERIRSLE